MRGYTKPLAVIGLTAALALQSALARSAELSVPSAAYPTIQSAVNAALAGDTVVVAAGTYREEIGWVGKNITLRGAGAGLSIIDPSVANGGPGGRCIYTQNLTSATLIEGFTLQNGRTIYSGGAIFNNSSSPTISRCVFRGNSARDGGAIYNSLWTSTTILNCAFIGNSATYGGAIESGQASSTTVINCTFVGNTASEGGGAIYNYYTSAAITNSIFWGNSALYANQIFGAAVVRYSVLPGLPNAVPDIDGNFNADPLFLNAANGDFRLAGGSPCINKGTNAAVTTPPFPTVGGVIVDLDGSPRVADGTVNMGAYESRINTAPVAVEDAYTTDEDTTLSVAAPGVLGNDTDADGDALTASLVSDTSNGVLKFYTDGSFEYKPNAGYSGTDSFQYHADDGTDDGNIVTVTIEVTPVNDAPVAEDLFFFPIEDKPVTFPLTGWDEEGSPLTVVIVAGPSNGSLFDNGDGTYTYMPHPNYNGYDSFTYRVNDGELDSNIATVSFKVYPVNDGPRAAADFYETSQDVALAVSAPGVLANDTDVEGDPLTAVLNIGPAYGSLTLNADGSFLYTPNAGFSGVDTFTYRASDGTNNSHAATVTINVKKVADYTAQIAAVQALKGQVQALVAAGAVLPADGQSLYAKLDAAAAALKAGDATLARTKLQDFINQVTSFIKTGKLTQAQGLRLIDAAKAILAQI